MAVTYYYSDGDITLTGNSSLDELSFYDDANGSFDPQALSFLRLGDNLLIRTGTGSTITITNHYLNSDSRYEWIKFYDINGNDYPALTRVDIYNPQIIGTTENATLTGTNSYDFIVGGTGDNIINGNGGADRIYGGDGDDTITVGNGSGEDVVYAGNGNDTLYASTEGKENLYGGADNDTFHTHASSTGASKFFGGAGDDTYYVDIEGAGATIEDSSGNDTIIFSAGISFGDISMQINHDQRNGYKIVADDSVVNANFSLLLADQDVETNFENVIFNDGTTYTLSTVANPITNQEHKLSWTADSADNVIYAAGGQYNLHAGDGDDIIYGKANSSSTDGLSGWAYQTYLYGDSGNDTIYIAGVQNSVWRGGFAFGGDGNDIIHGTNYADTMHGGDGDDIFYGGLTNGATTHDIFYAGNGDDTMYLGDSVFKTAYGENGSDVMIAGMTDVAVSQGIYTQMRGGADNDVYVFSRDDTNNKISYRAHVIDDSGDYDTIALGEGFNASNVNLSNLAVTDLHSVLDYYMVSVNPGFTGNVIERLSFSDGSVYVWGGSSYTQLTATTGDDTAIYLTAWHDVFDSLAGNDVVYALEGDDRLLGNAGNDHFDGGAGNDTMDYSNAAAGITAGLGSQSVSVDGDGGSDTLASIENITGSTYRDVIYGSHGANIIRGGNGNDYINSLGGADTLYGEDGNDTIYGGADTDTIDGGDGDDTIITYAGDDTVYGGRGRDMILAGANAQIDGGSDVSNSKDEVRFSTVETVNGVTVNLATGELYSMDVNDNIVDTGSITGVEYVRGTNQSDHMTGDAGNNLIVGYGGNDILFGGDGRDLVDGGDGDDIIYGGDGDDQSLWENGVKIVNASLVGGNGNDTIYGEGGSDRIVAGDGNDTVYGGTEKDWVYGGYGDDILYGDEGNDRLYGHQGNDVIYGGDDNDIIDGHAGDDVLNGDDGDDSIYGGDDNDILSGGSGVDILYGNQGNDTLIGGSGIDTLYGGDGDDVLESSGDKDYLYGESGADTFVFKDLPTYSDATLIHDFDLSEGDKLDVTDVLSGFDQSTDNINDYVTLAEAAGHTYLWADQNGTDAGGNVLLARLTGVTGLDLDTMYLDGDIII